MKQLIFMKGDPVKGSSISSLSQGGRQKVESVWRWGSDNMLPAALSHLSRNSTIHRRIINDKADYISGRGFSYDIQSKRLDSIIREANAKRETLRSIIGRLAFDKCMFGNAFLEVVTDRGCSFLSFYHQDASKCRISTDSLKVILHHDWLNFKTSQAQSLSLFPNFTKHEDGTYRAMIHYKDYEPMFENYGIPKYISAIGAASIAYKTDRWNVSRLDNAFQVSGVMVLDGEVDSQEEAADIARMAERKFAGNPGQVMFLVKNGVEGDTTKFVPITSYNDGDWRQLHDQATSDIIVAHSWFRTLSGMDYSTGFSPDRVQYEYNIALKNVISVEQHEILEPIKLAFEDVLSLDCVSLEFINRPPFDVKPPYMKVWEARKEDGYEYDPQSESMFLSQI